MLKRKIEAQLLRWKNTKNHNPLIVKGCRQCGKTFIVESFAKKYYQHVIYINFFEDPEFKQIFSGSLNIDNIISLITKNIGDSAQFIPHETLLILDEIQSCPDARTSLKFFKLDGRFDVIGTGSLLGIKYYNQHPTSIPVGYEAILDMYPLDFEEFLWANGITEDTIAYLRTCLAEEKPVPSPLHEQMQNWFLKYIVIGGMPNAVTNFLETKQLDLVLKIQKSIIYSYEDDMLKYADDKDKPLIRRCFESIPRQLSQEHKKFQASLIKKDLTNEQLADSIQWIEDAGIIQRSYNLSTPELPFDSTKQDEIFKLYMQDIGLFVGMLENGTQSDILKNKLYAYKDAIYQNVLADVFSKMGRKLYYYYKDSALQMYFVLRYKGEATLIEIQSPIVASPKNISHFKQTIKLGNYNIGRTNGENSSLKLPFYMAFLLTEY